MNDVCYAIIVYIVFVVVLAFAKPDLIYDGDKLRKFGSDEGETYMTLPVLSVLFIVVAYPLISMRKS